jgi:hypothetical protein
MTASDALQPHASNGQGWEASYPAPTRSTTNEFQANFD